MAVAMQERLRACLAVGITLGMSEVCTASLFVDPSGAACRKYVGVWGRLMVGGLGIDMRVRGGEAVDWSKPVVVMANHNSHLDIPVIFTALPRIFGMLAKDSLFKFPFFGRAMKGIGCVPIDRENAVGARDSIRNAARQVRGGDSIVVFPEGTRGDGTSVRPFKKGAFHLVQAAGVPIVPLGLRGTASICPKNEFKVFPGVVDVAIGTPIYPEGTGAAARTRLVNRVREAIVSLSGLPASIDA
jgi:1-acyl-sn-glycerol-3-phosphate acyltransferase